MIRVTELLVDEGFIDRTWFNEYGATRGSHVHTACLYYDQGELDEETLDPAIVPYLEGWKKFIADTGFQHTSAEERLTSNTYQITGQPDRIGMWPNRHPSTLDRHPTCRV
jgi:hypothetical protein